MSGNIAFGIAYIHVDAHTMFPPAKYAPAMFKSTEVTNTIMTELLLASGNKAETDWERDRKRLRTD